MLFRSSGYVSFGYIEKIQNGYTFKHFFLKKACRLLPLVAVSAVVYEVALGLYFKLYRQDWFGVRINFFGVITDALGIQNGWVFHDPGVNYPTWYISVFNVMLCDFLYRDIYWKKERHTGNIFLPICYSNGMWNKYILYKSSVFNVSNG